MCHDTTATRVAPMATTRAAHQHRGDRAQLPRYRHPAARPELGALPQSAQNVRSVALAPWLFIPGLFIVATVLAYNFVGDGLRDAADPYTGPYCAIARLVIPSRNMKTLTVKLPEHLAASLEREAERAQVSKSEMVRNILNRHLAGGARSSAVDLAGDLAGCVDSGVGDLSSNRAHLDGFGR